MSRVVAEMDLEWYQYCTRHVTDILRVKFKYHFLCSRKMIADIFGESGDEEEEEFTVIKTSCPIAKTSV